jgi:hypothetical protein
MRQQAVGPIGVSCLERSVKVACNELPGYCKRSVANEPYARRKKNTPGVTRGRSFRTNVAYGSPRAQ